MQVDPAFRCLKLGKLGIPRGVITILLSQDIHFWTRDLVAPEEVPFASVMHNPMIHLTGFPAVCSPREIRMAVRLLPGFRGLATSMPRSMLVAYVWWDTEAGAMHACLRLRELRIDPTCLAAMHVSAPTRWHLRKTPPQIHM